MRETGPCISNKEPGPGRGGSEKVGLERGHLRF